ncbi:FAD-dependent oxidoreductase [Patescibacteria group bacterium]|nr:FAD-dependent oxidoreductase [Patescibacteria group bacterium]
MELPVLRPFCVVRNAPLAEGVFELVLQPADRQMVFGFVPGQFIMLHLMNADGSVWAKTAYSIASAPFESKDTITLAIKLRGDFTRRARDLQLGDIVKVQGPYGKFTLPDDDRDVIMLAGGIGVAPFRSMIREAVASRINKRIILLYSCKTAEGMAFLDELRGLAARNAKFMPTFFLTGCVLEEWRGEIGRINQKSLHKYVPYKEKALFMVCGSHEFTDDMVDILRRSGVDVANSLRKEMF